MRIEEELRIENPQLEVTEVKDVNLEPVVISRWIVRMLERGQKQKIVIHRALDRIMRAGAMGGEIILKGKMQAKKAKARKERVAAGYIKKAGDAVKQVMTSHEGAKLKQGVMGITVSIVPGTAQFPDKIDISEALAKHRQETPERKPATEEQVTTPASVEIENTTEEKTSEENGNNENE